MRREIKGQVDKSGRRPPQNTRAGAVQKVLMGTAKGGVGVGAGGGMMQSPSDLYCRGVSLVDPLEINSRVVIWTLWQ